MTQQVRPIPEGFHTITPHLVCSGAADALTFYAQAFGAVRYPILPRITRAGNRQARREILYIRDSSLYTPRDFDISPYFEIIKPTIEYGFDYTKLHWADTPKPPREVAAEDDPFPERVFEGAEGASALRLAVDGELATLVPANENAAAPVSEAAE